jgi:hypothetical protein
MSDLQTAIREYHEIREANAANIPLEQFKAVSTLLNRRDADTDYSVARAGDILTVEMSYDGFLFFGSVAPDGTVTWR